MRFSNQHTPRLKLEDVSFAYEKQPVLRAVNLSTRPGEILALVGPNGSGKTTLLQLMSGVLKPNAGVIQLGEADLTLMKANQRAKQLAGLEQEHHVGFEFTAREIVSWGRIPHRARLSRWRSCDEQAVVEAMKQTETVEFAERPIHTLSGGERQRVFIAMALAQEPQILLLDEPTAHLDLKHQHEVMTLVQSLAHQGLTVVVALHDLNLTARYAQRVAVLDQGRLVSIGSPRQTLTEALIERVWQLPVRLFHAFDQLIISA